MSSVDINMDFNKLSKKGLISISFALLLIIVFSSAIYTVEEGHVGIVKRFGKAIEMTEPGIHWKMPFTDDIRVMEVRTRKNQEDGLKAATKEQMPITASVAINWLADKEDALNIYKKFGGLSQFESRILDPRLRDAAKTSISKYTAEQLIATRDIVVGEIHETLQKKLEGYLVTFDSVQLVQISLPAKYTKAVEAKQVELQKSEEEQHKLTRQQLTAQQKVNTANAERDATKAEADGTAYKITTEATARAEAIRVEGEAKAEAAKKLANAIAGNPLVVQYLQVQQWKGEVPTTVLGNNTDILMGMPGMARPQR